AAFDTVNGIIDDSFAARVEAPGGVLALARQPYGKLVIGGEFAYAGDLLRNNLARMNVDGTIDTTWHPDTDGAVTALAANETGIYVADLFKVVGGLNRDNLARIPLVARDSADPRWDPGLGTDIDVRRPVQTM